MLAAFLLSVVITSPHAPGRVFCEPQRARFSFSGAARVAVRDWTGRSVAALSASNGCDFGRLPTGYYRAFFSFSEATPVQEVRFAVVPDPAGRPIAPSASAVDSALSWVSDIRRKKLRCEWQDGNAFAAVTEIMRRAGVRHARERLSASALEPEEGCYDGGYFLENARRLRAAGIRVDGLVATPMKRGRARFGIPTDLLRVYDFCFRTARAFDGAVEQWEFWNEQDIRAVPAWDYAAAQKAASLGFRAGGASVLLPGASTQRYAALYARVQEANGVSGYVDALNFHCYLPLSRLPERMADVYGQLGREACAGRAVYVTEAGSDEEGTARLPGSFPPFRAHDWEQELDQADKLVKMQVMLRHLGAARVWSFVFGAYNERGGEKDWGFLRRDLSAKPAVAAFSTLTFLTDGLMLKGRAKMGANGKAYVYADAAGRQTLLFWGGKTAETVRVPAKDPVVCCDFLGHRHVVPVLNGFAALRVGRYPCYATNLLEMPVDEAARPAGVPRPYEPAADEDLSVVLRADLSPKDFKIASGGAAAEMLVEHGNVSLEVWNLDDEPKVGSLNVSGVRLAGVPQEVCLGPWDVRRFETVLTCSGPSVSNRHLNVSGVFNGARVSPLVVPVVDMPGLMRNGCAAVPDWRDPARWIRNDSATQGKVTWDEREQAIRIEAHWKGRTVPVRWCYPRLTLHFPQASPAGARMLSFDIRSRQDKVENDYHTANVYIGRKKGERIRYLPPSGRWESRRVTLGKPFDPAAVSEIRIGGNPNGRRLVLWIRNVRFD